MHESEQSQATDNNQSLFQESAEHSSADPILATIGASASEIGTFLELVGKVTTNREICICGHPSTFHVELGEKWWTCNYAKSFCPCATRLPILEVQDKRYFMRTTRGPGNRHALAVGLHRLAKEKKWARFIFEPFCFKCESSDDQLIITSLTSQEQVSTKPEKTNVLLCRNCFIGLGGFSFL